MMRRLWEWCDKVFDLPGLLSSLPGAGFSARYDQTLVTTIIFSGMLMRLPSLNALELSLRNQRAWRKLLGASRLPSADTLARGLEKSDTDALRAITREINHRLRRNKSLGDGAASHGLMAAAVDGFETFSSERRCCRACLTRKKTPAAGR